MRKRGETLAVEFALLFKFRNVSINLRESILFQLAKRATEFEIPQHDRTIHLERACRPLEKLIKFSFAPPPPSPPPLFSRRNFCRWEGDKNRKKKMEGKKGEEERRGEERRAGHASLRLQTVPNRPTRIWRWYLEKKHEMIDDRPILVATYGVPYPPGCSYNGHRRNLFPQAGDVTSPMSFQSKFLLNDSQV